MRDGQFDASALSETTRVAVCFLDDVIDATPYFLPENESAQKGVHRVGLGTMELADALLALGVPYGSDESLAAIEEIYRTIRDAAYDASADLAAEKGPFPKFDRDRFLELLFIRRLPETIRTKIAAHGIRNGTLLCQAPTGTTSLLAGVSSGIEPVFDFRLVHRDRLGEHPIEQPAYRTWYQAHPSSPLPPSFVTGGQLTPEEHVRVNAKIQQYTDASISKTTRPEDAYRRRGPAALPARLRARLQGHHLPPRRLAAGGALPRRGSAGDRQRADAAPAVTPRNNLPHRDPARDGIREGQHPRRC